MSELLQVVGAFAAIMVVCTGFLTFMGKVILSKHHTGIVDKITTTTNSFKTDLSNHAEQSRLRMDLLQQAQNGVKSSCDQVLDYVKQVDEENQANRERIHGIDKRVAVLETKRGAT